MKYFLNIIYLFTLLFPAIHLSARNKTDISQKIHIENSSIKKDQGDLSVALNITLPEELVISSNRFALLVPVLKGDGQTRLLPSIAVYGRKREIIAERTGNKPDNAYEILRRQNKTRQSINYTVRIPFESWMSGSEIHLIEDLCGCGNLSEEKQEVYLTSMPPKYISQPQPVYMTPQVEEIKTRYKESSSFIDYAVNKVTIDSTYRNNLAEIAKIHETFEDQQMQEIRKINIHGFASPEGNYNANKRLAQGRTEALKNYIRNRYGYPESVFSISSTPENWEGLRKLVVESDIVRKDEILAIIDSNVTEDTKEARLKQFGSIYVTMLRDWFPILRRADYQIEYIVPDYDTETAARMAHERPQLVSILEMFEAAMAKPKGGKEYNELFEIAARTFPDSPIVNNNAAAMEIERGNLKAARDYLVKVKGPSGETYNNMGCIALLEGDFQKADQYFKAAQAAGVSQAQYNLEELKKKEENYNIRGEL